MNYVKSLFKLQIRIDTNDPRSLSFYRMEKKTDNTYEYNVCIYDDHCQKYISQFSSFLFLFRVSSCMEDDLTVVYKY